MPPDMRHSLTFSLYFAVGITPRTGKAMRKDAALQVLSKRQADIRLGGVTLPVELACNSERVPGLEVFGYGLVQQ